MPSSKDILTLIKEMKAKGITPEDIQSVYIKSSSAKPVRRKTKKQKIKIQKDSYRSRIESTMIAYNEIFGEIDTRFHQTSNRKLQREFLQFWRERGYIIPNHTRTKRLSRKEKLRFKKTIKFLQIDSHGNAQRYPSLR